MAYLLDTSILLRLVNENDVHYSTALNAVATLLGQGETLHVTAQVLIEFRNGMTRPAANNGLGFAPLIAAQEAAQLEATFSLLPETPAIYLTWKWIADTLGVIGKQVHDARLVAVCHVHGITHILTFNVRHFQRFQSVGPGLVVVDPNSI